VKLNLKTHSATQQHSYTKKAKGYPIPTLINGQISSKDSSLNIKQTPPQQQKMKQKTTKMLESSSSKRNKVLITGDSHVRGLSEKIRNHLNVAFNVSGITKPNADAKSVTSSLHFEAENLTKKDLLIFYGGTRDISRNETSKGLKALKAFAHRTIHTNVFLLEAPQTRPASLFMCEH
jgi:hypothetical protein